MDEALVKKIAEDIVNAKIYDQWQLYLGMIAIAFLVGFFSAYVGAYAKKRGEQHATKKDFDELLSQIKQTTAVAEDVKAKVTHADWISREWKTLRRLKLEELLQIVHEAQEWLDREKIAEIFESGANTEFHPLAKIERISGLYFPELSDCIYEYCQEFRKGAISIVQFKMKLIGAQANSSAKIQIRNEFTTFWMPLYQTQLENVRKIEKEARMLMIEIVSS